MYGPPQHHASHHVRFYIVMITLVVGGIFFLLMMNNNNDISFTGALIGDSGEELMSTSNDSVPEEEVIEGTPLEKKIKVEEAFSEQVDYSNNELAFVLNAEAVPNVYDDVKIEDLVLSFSDLKTIITVNGDHLELNDLKEVELRIVDYKGTVDFNEQEFSLDGLARRIEVNDVALSSKGDIKMSFEGLKYDSFSIDRLKLDRLDIPRTDGHLSVGNKFQYALDEDEVKLFYYVGSFDVNGNETTVLQGTIRGISVSGTELNVNVN
jgi:hypothetical protein